MDKKNEITLEGIMAGFDAMLAKSATEFDRKLEQSKSAFALEMQKIRKLQAENAKQIGGMSNNQGAATTGLFYNSLKYGQKKMFGESRKMKVTVLILTVFSLSLFSCKSSSSITVLENSNMDDVIILPLVDIKPMFNGKEYEDSFREYILQNARYPLEAMKNNISGTVVVQFIIEKDGSVSNEKVIKSIHKLLDSEALRLIKTSPKWTPALKEHEQVRVLLNFPVTFKFLGVFKN